MKVVISSGHGKYIRGAKDLIDEVDEARLVVEEVANVLREMEVDTITYHDDVSDDQNENLNRIVDFHNSKTRDLDVSVHFNSTGEGTRDSPIGTEVWYVSSAGLEVAEEVVDGIANSSGLKNRGTKHSSNLFFLNNTEEPAILIEVCFVDSRADVDIYHESFTDICIAIAEDISGKEAGEGPGPIPPEPTPIPPPETEEKETIMAIARASALAQYEWPERSLAPMGYIQGFALAWAGVVKRFLRGDPVVLEMAKARTSDPDIDALTRYNVEFDKQGMSNGYTNINTLRHLFVLLYGLGMRESSGRHCEGRDMSADNVSADTAEAGLYQTSYNAHTSSKHFDTVMAEYEAGKHEYYIEEFSQEVTCTSSEWGNYGSGKGKDFQMLCKEAPPFAMESCALVLRNRCLHYGPIKRKEAEVRIEADWMLTNIQRYIIEGDTS